MIEASCHCGAVKLEIQSAPNGVTDCNCSICRRYGVLWAYYEPAQVAPEVLATARVRRLDGTDTWKYLDE
jgi:hypothetical protein